MKIKIFIVLLVFSFSSGIYAQKLITKEGKIKIFSQTPLFTIEAVNNKVASILNTQTGDIVVSTLVRSFKFREALVEEHFNENYMDSEKYPKAVFMGKIVNYHTIDFSKDGEYKAVVVGKLTIHGTTNKIEDNAKIIVKDKKIRGELTFDVSLSAFNIRVEKTYKKAIKDEIKLRVDFAYKPYKQSP
jgi:hypothetical protein